MDGRRRPTAPEILSVSRLIAEHVAGVSATTLPDRVARATARSVLDAVGVSVGASGIGDGCGPFLRLAATRDRSGSCHVLGTGLRVDVSLAALVNGALAHALDFEDAHDGAMVHPHAAPVAAGLALAEQLASSGRPVGGRRFLAAIAVGADLVCRLGFLLTTVADSRGWYPPPIFGAVGAAATTANLLDLEPGGVLDALSLVTCQATCFGELKRSPRSVVRAVRDAFGAQGAVTAALLAADGVTGFDQPFEGAAGLVAMYGDGSADPERLLDGLGATFHGAEVSFKPWPSCRGTHAFVAAALAVRQEVAGRPVRSINASGGSANSMLVEPREQKVAPRTAIEAKFSLPFTVATALVKGCLKLADFDESALADHRVLDLARRVHFTVDDVTMPGSEWGALDVTLESGESLRQTVDCLPGSPALPIGDAGLIAKFIDCAALAASPIEAAAARRYAEQLLALPEVDNAAVAFQCPRVTVREMVD